MDIGEEGGQTDLKIRTISHTEKFFDFSDNTITLHGD